ncbi:MAG: amidohydrolase family protein [Planctomycetota bacterium]
MDAPKDPLEKVELHCHLDGLLSPPILEAVQAKGMCPELDLGKMRGLFPVTSLESWFRLGAFQAPFVNGNGELLLEILKLHLKDLVSQHVKYAEIMLCSFLGIEEERLLRLLGEYQKAAEEQKELEVVFLWAVGRTPDRVRFERKIERIISLWRKGFIHGLALAGDEKACRVKDVADIFQCLAEEGMPVEIHAGEWCGPDSIWDALEYGHPRRIGHGLSLFDDPNLPAYFLENDIHIEFCPTSNLKVSGIRRIEDHPVFKAMDYGLCFSINTDDPGHFECTMNSEFALLQGVRPLDEAMFRKVFRDSLRAGFGRKEKDF